LATTSAASLDIYVGYIVEGPLSFTILLLSELSYCRFIRWATAQDAKTKSNK